MSLHSTTFCNFGQNCSFRHFRFKTCTPTILHLITLSVFFKFWSKLLLSLFSSFSLESLNFPMHHAIALSDFFCNFHQNRSASSSFWSFFLAFGARFVPHELSLMLYECYYTRQVFVIFIKIVLFVVFIIFVGVFEPSYALWHCTEQFFFSCENCSHHFSWHLWTFSCLVLLYCTQQFFCNFVSFVDHFRLFVTFVNFVILCNTEHIS